MKKPLGTVIIVDRFRVPGKPVFRKTLHNGGLGASVEKPKKKPYKPPVVGEIRGPWYPENSSQRYMVYGHNGWIPIDHLPWESESECLQRAEKMSEWCKTQQEKQND